MTQKGEESNVGYTAVILAKDEERAIVDCIRRVLSHATEVVVVDSHSTDRTAELARSAGARVVDFEWNGAYPKKKEWSLANAGVTTEWVLLLDADELVSPELAMELAHVVEQDIFDALYLPLTYYWRGVRLNHGQRVKKLAFLKRSRVSFPRPDDLMAPGIREVEGHYQPAVRGRTGEATGQLLHLDPDPVSEWYARHNRYSDWEAFLRTSVGTRAKVRAYRSRQGQILDRLPLAPLMVFVYNYFVRGGWLDGRVGLEYAASLAFYHFQIQVKVRERVRGNASSVADMR